MWNGWSDTLLPKPLCAADPEISGCYAVYFVDNRNNVFSLCNSQNKSALQNFNFSEDFSFLNPRSHLNWLCKHMKNVRSRQPCISMSFALNSVKHKFFPESIVKSFSKFTRRHMCPSLFAYKVIKLHWATLLKQRFWHRCSMVNFEKTLRTPFL